MITMKSGKLICIIMTVCITMCLCACGQDAQSTTVPKLTDGTIHDPSGTTTGSETNAVPSEEWIVVPDSYLIFELNVEKTGYQCLGFQEQWMWEDQQYMEKYPYCAIPDTYNGLPVVQIVGGWGWNFPLKGISIPDSVTSLQPQVFSGMASLKKAVIPSSVTEFGDGIFMNCVNLEEVTLGNGIQYFGGQCFQGCTSLERITLPGSLQSISMSEFADCSTLEEIILPENLKNIARNAFKNCASLISISIPSNVNSIGNGVFDGCTALQEITFQGTVEQWYSVCSASVPDGCVVHCIDGDA